MNEKMIKYLKMQIKLGKLSKEQVVERYPEIVEHLEEEQQEGA